MTRARRLKATIALLAVGVIGLIIVRSRSRPPSSTPGTGSALEAEFSGCRSVVADTICELPTDRTLRLWVRAPAGAIAFSTDAAQPVATQIREVQGGILHRVVVPIGARELRVLSHAPQGDATFSLRVETRLVPKWLEDARELRQKGNLDLAADRAKDGVGSANPAERAAAIGLLARIELARGRQEASFPLFREAIELDERAGRISDAVDDSFALVFALNQRSHRYAEARSVLDKTRSHLSMYPDGRARESYYRGALAMETGDPRTALRTLREAREYATRLGLDLLERNATNAYSLQLARLGRTREALESLSKLERDATTARDAAPCEHVEIAINLGFGALLANEATSAVPASDDAVRPLERALSLCEAQCKDPYLRAAALGNLALAALQKGEIVAARTRLAQAKAGISAPRLIEVLFWYELEGRIALADGDGVRALAAFDEESRLAEGALLGEEQWRATFGRAASFELLRRNDQALAAYRAAEAMLADLSLLVPLSEGRSTFLGDREKGARWAIDLLVRLGRGEEAMTFARSSRARVVTAFEREARLESLGPEGRTRWETAIGAYRRARAALEEEAKDDWKLARGEAAHARAARRSREAELRVALDEAMAVLARGGALPGRVGLAPLPRDALTIAYHPVRRGWVGFASDADGTTTFLLADAVTDAQASLASERLLGPVRTRVARAKLVRFLPYGPLRSIDFHALPHEGQPLVATVPVEYPLDLPPAASDAPTRTALALVVADPSLDLAAARAEGVHVAKALADAGGWRVELLVGSRATTGAVSELLGRALLFHYAGHGLFGGRETWASALPLASGGHLAVGDILAVERVPSRVVLSGCETARTSADAPAEGLGLAQAFIAAGSEFVVAPVRRVDDRLAARLSSELYGELARPGPVDPAAALRQVQARLHAEDPASDWSAFRVLRR